jgi:hypothetical protein
MYNYSSARIFLRAMLNRCQTLLFNTGANRQLTQV